ncbi:MAG: hypothetical protein ACLFVY_02675 [Phycisphaerae bacterium]
MIEYVRVLVWPTVVVFAFLLFRKSLQNILVRPEKIKFSIGGVTVETSIEQLTKSVSESLRGKTLSDDQWDWLTRLSTTARLSYDHQFYETLRPLRNAGLIREHPEGWLSNSKEIEITTLGRLLLEAKAREQ